MDVSDSGERFEETIGVPDVTLDNLEELTRDELKLVAKKHKLTFRSNMLKSQLQKIVKEGLFPDAEDVHGDANVNNPIPDDSSNSSVELLRLQIELSKQRMAEQERLHELKMIEQEKHEEHIRFLQHTQAETNPSSLGVFNAFGSRTNTSETKTHRIDVYSKMLPKLQESCIDEWFQSFERCAELNKWPREIYVSIISTHFVSKMLKVYNSLPLSDAADYAMVKQASLAAYQQTPHTYRKKFRSFTKSPDQTFMDFNFHLSIVLDKWLQSLNAMQSVETLREVFLQEQFLHVLPAELKQHAATLIFNKTHELARALDDYVGLQKAFGCSSQPSNTCSSTVNVNCGSNHNKVQDNQFRSRKGSQNGNKSGELSSTKRFQGSCFNCGKQGHKSSDCWSKAKAQDKFPRKTGNRNNKQSNNFAGRNNSTYNSNRNNHAVNANVIDDHSNSAKVEAAEIHNILTAYFSGDSNVTDTYNKTNCDSNESIDKYSNIHPLFVPYVKDIGIISENGNWTTLLALRDSAALQSLISVSVSSEYYKHTGESRLIRGIDGLEFSIPLVECNLDIPNLFAGVAQVGLVSTLPKGIDFLLSNDLWLKHSSSDVEDLCTNAITRSKSKLKALDCVSEDSVDDTHDSVTLPSMFDDDSEVHKSIRSSNTELTGSLPVPSLPNSKLSGCDAANRISLPTSKVTDSKNLT